jgi:hypothetical protein
LAADGGSLEDIFLQLTTETTEAPA